MAHELRRPGQTRLALILPLLLILCTTAVFWPVTGNEFVSYDDREYLVDNPVVGRGLTGEGVRWAFGFHAANWHPVTWLSHMLDVQLFGLDPFKHHLVGILLHSVNAALLWTVLYLGTAAPWSALAAAALFSLHPQHVESVAWASERKDLLSMFFLLLVLLAWGRYTRRRSAGNYTLVLALFTLGLMAKPMLVTVPLVLLVVDLWPLGRWPEGWRRLVAEKLPFLALAAGSGILTLLAQSREGTIALNVGPGMRVLGALAAYGAYLWRTLVPTGLAAFYPPPGTAAPLVRAAVLSGLLLGLVTPVVFLLSKRRPWLAAGWAWYLITLAPVSGLVRIGSQLNADRYTYIPLVGVFLALAWEAASRAAGSRQARIALTAAFAIAAALCVPLARDQMRYWRDDTALFSRMLQATPDNWFGHLGLTRALIDRGQPAAALEQALRAVAIRPDIPEVQSNAGAVLQGIGRFEAALPYYRRALQARPEYLEALNGLGVSLVGTGQAEEGLAALRRVKDRNPDSPDVWYNLGYTLGQLGRTPEAEASYRRAVALKPGLAEAWNNLGDLLNRQGRSDEAEQAFQRVVEIKPRSAEAHFNLGQVAAARGRLAQAEQHLRQALECRPGFAAAHGELARTLARLGRQEEAGRHLAEARRLAPTGAW